MPSFYIQENIINNNFLSNLKNGLNTCTGWVMYEDNNENCKYVFSNIRDYSTLITSNIDNCSQLVNKFYSTIYLNNDDRYIIPPTYYLLNNKWIVNTPDNNNNKWIIKDVWDYSENNSKIYNNINECLATTLINKYYVVQSYIKNLNLVRCYLLVFRNFEGTQFLLFKDGYYDFENDENYQRLKNHNNYNTIFNDIKKYIKIHLNSLSKNVSKKSDQLYEFQLFEYLFGINDDNCYLLNCSIQISIYEKNTQVFNILSNVITNDIINDLLNPVIKHNDDIKIKEQNMNSEECKAECKDECKDECTDECKEEWIQILDNSRWENIILDNDYYEISKFFLEVLNTSKKNIYRLNNSSINTYFFDSINANNSVYGLQKILEGLGDWKESKTNIGFSDTENSVIKFGLNMNSILNISIANEYLESKYLPVIYCNINNIIDIDSIWFIKNIGNNQLTITNNIQDHISNETTIDDDFIVIDDTDIIIYQKEIPNLMLINNRKFIIKAYCVLAGNNNEDTSTVNVLLYNDGIILCAPENYDSNSINENIHSFTNISSNINDISNYALHLLDWEKYNVIFPKIQEVISNYFNSLCKKHKFKNMAIELLSFDFAVDKNNNIYLVDIITNPVIMNDKRMWHISVKTMMNIILKDMIDMIVIPYLNDDKVEIQSRWITIS